MKKLLNKKGFTLMEMLIVVAIIVILVAISVPTFSSNLDEAKSATDVANMRAAKSAAVMYQLDKGIPSGGVYYDADKGIISETTPKGYKQVTEDGVGSKGDVIKITYTAATATSDEVYTYKWVTPTAGGGE